MEASAKATELMIIKLEKKYPEKMFIDSEARGLYYASNPYDGLIEVFCSGGSIKLTRGQMYALCKEGNYIYDTYAKNGHVNTKAVKIKRYKENNSDEVE